MNTNNLIAIYIQFQTSLNSPAGAVKRQVLSKGRCCMRKSFSRPPEMCSGTASEEAAAGKVDACWPEP